MSVSRDTKVFKNSCFVSRDLQRNRSNRMCAYTERKWFSGGIGSWDGGALADPKSNRGDRLKPQEGVAVWGSLLWNQKEGRVADDIWKLSASQFPLLWGRRSVFCAIQAFNWLDEAHQYYRWQSALLKVHQFKCKSCPKIFSQKHPE